MESYGTHLGAMGSDIDHNNSTESGFQHFVIEEMVSYPARMLQLKMSAKHYHQKYLEHNGTDLTQLLNKANGEISKHPLGKNTFQKIKRSGWVRNQGAQKESERPYWVKRQGPAPRTHMKSTKSSLML